MKHFRASGFRFSAFLPLGGLILGACLSVSRVANAKFVGEKANTPRPINTQMMDGFEVGNGADTLFAEGRERGAVTVAAFIARNPGDPLLELLAPFVKNVAGDRLEISRIPANEFGKQEDIRHRRAIGNWEPIPLGPLVAVVRERMISPLRREVEMHLFRNRSDDPKASSEVIVAVAQGPKEESSAWIRSFENSARESAEASE